MTPPAIPKTGSTPRADRVSARRRQLVELTMQLLKEKGFDLLSVNELAERASMSVGGLYRYIKTKSDLLEMICDETNKGLNEQMMARTAAVRGVKKKLRAGFEVYWQGCWDAAGPILTAYREWQSLPEAAQHRYIEQEKRVAEYFSDLIRAGVASDEFRAVDARLLAAEMIFLAQMWALKGWAFHGWDRADVFAEHWELIESRLRKK